MVIGLLILSSIPIVTGVGQGYSQQQAAIQRQKDAHRMRRFNIHVHCDADSLRTKEIHGARLYVRDHKVFLVQRDREKDGDGYLVSAFYIEYPTDKPVNPPPLGLVSQVSDDPPMLHWIYIDKDTMELKYGNKTESKDHYVGPWDWTKKDERRVVFEKAQLFTAVEVEKDVWQVYFDPNRDLLEEYVPKCKTRLRIRLERVIAVQPQTPT